ncbi:sensor histidine kinase [Vibrio sp. TRT 17S01]|uniref:sensor histidine kinase n=1 Tax=Vibrio sp. TRT 17S01 TaxID=3418505 RepID=UPI003CECE1AD
MLRKTLIAIAVAMFLFLSQWITTQFVYQWKTEQTLEAKQQDLLNYIGDVRRALKRFYHLPYLITNSSGTLRLVTGETQLKPTLTHELTLLDQAANTKGWYLLSNTGQVLVSSNKNKSLPQADIQSIVDQIHQQGEGVTLVSRTRGSTPFYYLAAPVYHDLDIAGIAVVQINLSLLTEQWLTSDDLLFVQNQRLDYFLSTSSQYPVSWLNDNAATLSLTDQTLNSGTRIKHLTLSQPYLAQQVKLDDLQWQLSYLSPLAPIRQLATIAGWSVALFNLLLILLLIIIYQRRQKALGQMRIQKLLQESQQRLNQIINKTQVGLLLLDNNGRLFEINPMAQRLFSLPDNLAKQTPAWHLFDVGNPNSTTLQLLKNLSRHRELAEITGVETLAKRSDSSLFPVLFSLTSFVWHGEPYYLATVLDISKRKKAEQALQQANQALAKRVETRTEQLKQAQQELIESSKLAALGRMSSAITHELNQPLTGLKTLITSNEVLMVRGESQLLQDNNRLIHQLIERMTRMTTQLKSFAYNKPESLHPVSLTDAIAETLRIYQAELASIDVHVRLATQLPNVMGEEQRIRQILGNLIKNAIDALHQQTQPQLVISACQIDKWIEVSITDNGCGADDNQLDHMFEPFMTSKKIGEGLGLGLSISANNIRDMQGMIEVKRNKSAGLTFTFRLLAQ